MELETMISLVVAIGAVGSSILGMPWLVQRKLNEAIETHFENEKPKLELEAQEKVHAAIGRRLENYPTKLEMFERFVPRTEFVEHRDGIGKELRFLRRITLAIAHQLKVNVNEHEDD